MDSPNLRKKSLVTTALLLPQNSQITDGNRVCCLAVQARCKGDVVTLYFRDHDKSSNLSEAVRVNAPPLDDTIYAGTYSSHGKKALDYTLVCLSAPFTIVLVGFLALLVSLSGGKPFYSQSRVGRDGRLFRMWKLRSMVVGADQVLAEHLESNPDAQAEWDLTQKLKNDPRVTRLGRFMRRTSMDELPQLWNVIAGDMSLVGPRPMLPSQMSLYPGETYYTLKPGITGLWQVTARNSSSFADRANYDSQYSKALSLKEDCRILAATLRVVVRATGH